MATQLPLANLTTGQRTSLRHLLRAMHRLERTVANLNPTLDDGTFTLDLPTPELTALLVEVLDDLAAAHHAFLRELDA